MKSFERYMDGPTLAAEVRMERQKHKGSFLLVEGASDIKRFERLVDEAACSFVNCFGKDNVVEAIEQLYEDGFPGALGMVDADFDRLLQNHNEHEGIVASGHHDFDLDTVSSTCFERYIREVGDDAKIAEIGGVRALFAEIISAIRPLGALKYANVKHELGYCLKRVDMSKFFDGKKIDVESMISEVSQGRFNNNKSKSSLADYVVRYAESGLDPLQLTSGHDFCEALGLALRNIAGKRLAPQTWRSEIEMHFRLAFDAEHFAETAPAGNVKKWERDNSPYQILRKAA